MAAAQRYAFGPFELDASTRRLTRRGETVALADRHFGVLLELVSHPDTILSKDALIAAVWRDVAVTDNSLEQAISALRKLVGSGPQGPLIQTVARQGYRFTGEVTRTAARMTDDALDALLAPHRAWIEGRAALESLEREQIGRARDVFEGVLRDTPDQASAHVGLANACVMQFEMTRADELPDVAALRTAAHHAKEACRLAPDYGEAWATLAFVLDRTGHRTNALAASRRAAMLEPDNWRHHLRLSYVGWGEERLRAAQRTLALVPGFPLAHWLAATVHVARQALAEAERELTRGIDEQARQQASRSRFSSVALHWLMGLIHLARGETRAALEAFDRELACEAGGHLYGRECCANTWYAIGAVRFRDGDAAAAAAAFTHAIARVPRHPMAHLGLAAVQPGDAPTREMPTLQRKPSIDTAMSHAVALTLSGRPGEAASMLDEALAAAEPGNGGWILPIEPLLNASSRPDIWSAVLTRLRGRAA